MARWHHITQYTLAFCTFIAPSYYPERYHMRGPGAGLRTSPQRLVLLIGF
jgi:hypothetical protein